MSRCGRTESLLAATSEGEDLSVGQADHAASCAECGRALALARRFEGELARVGIDLATEPGHGLEGAAIAMLPAGGRPMTFPRRFMGGIGALAAVTALVFFGGRWIGSLATLTPGSDGAIRASAASFVGVPPDEVLITEDGVLAIDDRGAVLDLVLVNQSSSGPVGKVLGSASSAGTGTVFGTVTCLEDDQLERTDYLWGRWQSRPAVTGPGTFVVGASNRLIFAFHPAESLETRSLVIADTSGEQVSFGSPPGSFEPRRCLERDFDPHAEPILAGRLRCSGWSDLDDEVRRAVVDALVDREMEDAIRDAHAIEPEDVRESVIVAAVGSIDKWCNDPAAEQRMISDLLAGGYPSSD